jgi:hypothetical protein
MMKMGRKVRIGQGGCCFFIHPVSKTPYSKFDKPPGLRQENATLDRGRLTKRKF